MGSGSAGIEAGAAQETNPSKQSMRIQKGKGLRISVVYYGNYRAMMFLVVK
jgi:hypothetical protein